MTSPNSNWCPVFKPTKDEFSKPFSLYVENVLKRHPDIAMFKVVPPRGWSPRASHLPAMDKLCISTPIRQHVFGTRGAYRCLLEEQKSMTVKEFREQANSPQHAPSKKYSEDDELMERAFWRSITSNPATYGADNPLSLFDEKLGYGWNLRNLGDLLKTKDVPNIPGVTTPMTYFGMWKSFFSWHLEDVDLLSINYLHFGASKVWYCLAPSEAKRFEATASTLFPDLRKHCKAFLRHKDIMFSPNLLRMHNIKYVQCKQEPGEFVVLNAGAYHAGYNQGFNCAEAVNFALESWVPIGAHATRCSCSSLRDGVRIEMGIFGWHETSSDDDDSDEDEDDSDSSDDSSDDSDSNKESSSSEDEDSSDESSMSCSDSCPGPGTAKGAQRAAAAAKRGPGRPPKAGKPKATAKAAGVKKTVGKAARGTTTDAAASNKRQKTTANGTGAGRAAGTAGRGNPLQEAPRRPRSTPVKAAPAPGPNVQVSPPMIVMMADGTVVVQGGQGQPGKAAPLAATVPGATGRSSGSLPNRSRPVHPLQQNGHAAPPERSAVVKRALAEAHALARARTQADAGAGQAISTPAPGGGRSKKRKLSEGDKGAADEDQKLGKYHVVYDEEGVPVDLQLHGAKPHGSCDSESDHCRSHAGRPGSVSQAATDDKEGGGKLRGGGGRSGPSDWPRWKPPPDSTGTGQGGNTSGEPHGKPVAASAEHAAATRSGGGRRGGVAAAPKKTGPTASRTAFLEDGACPVSCTLASNQKEVMDSEVVQQPLALIGEDGGKPYFCIMQKLRRRASRPGCVVLRQLKECVDGLFRPGDLTWEEQEDKLKPVRMQFLPEHARRQGGYKLLTSRTSIMASYNEQQL